MTVVRVSCDWCGTVELGPGDITLDLRERAYRFDCPTCESGFTRPANVRVVAVLTNLGCPTVDELGPITQAEIDEFVMALDQE